MKTSQFLKAMTAALAGGLLLAGTTLATPRKAINLTALAGNFKGTMTVSALGFTFPGTATIKNKISPSGRSAKVQIAGSVQISGTYPFGAKLSLLPSGRCTLTDIVLNQPLGVSGSGTYQQKSRTKVVGTAVVNSSSGTITFVCTFTVKPQGSTKKRLVGSIVMSVNGSTVATVALDAIAHTKS
jgi:hypothetical protein